MTRAEAAKTNGALSSGPKTQAGKAVSSRNAIKHGLTAAEIVVSGEDPRAFEILRYNIEVDTVAKTVRELDMVFELAAARWRLRRLAIMEKALVDREMDRMNESLADPANQRTPEAAYADAWLAIAEHPTMKQIHRHETRLHRHYEKTRRELQDVVDFRASIEMKGESIHPCTLSLLQEDEAEAQAAEAAEVETLEQIEPASVAPVTSRPSKVSVQNEPVRASATPKEAAARAA